MNLRTKDAERFNACSKNSKNHTHTLQKTLSDETRQKTSSSRATCLEVEKLNSDVTEQANIREDNVRASRRTIRYANRGNHDRYSRSIGVVRISSTTECDIRATTMRRHRQMSGHQRRIVPVNLIRIRERQIRRIVRRRRRRPEQIRSSSLGEHRGRHDNDDDDDDEQPTCTWTGQPETMQGKSDGDEWRDGK